MTQPNAIDVTKIHEDQLLGHLGKADWVIVLPEELPNLSITTQWRRALQAYSGKQFVRWVMEGIDRLLTHDYDPPWDHSGNLRKIETDPLILLARHDSLADWAKNEYTGQSEATFTSGMGLVWTTYAEAIRDYIEEQLTGYFRDHCLNFWNIEDEERLFEDERWNDSDIHSIIWILSSALLEDTLQFSTADAWNLFESDIRAENEARREKAEQYQQMQKQVRQFWELYFPDLMDIRIEMPMFREMGLEKRIAEVLADADPDIVQMMAEIHGVHFPGNYSNTVIERIKEIVHHANM